jgi:hypothetical protein
MPVPEPVKTKVSPWGIKKFENEFVPGFWITYEGVRIHHVCMVKHPRMEDCVLYGFDKLKEIKNYNRDKVMRYCLYDEDVKLSVECVGLVAYFNKKSPLRFILDKAAIKDDPFAICVLHFVHNLEKQDSPQYQ